MVMSGKKGTLYNQVTKALYSTMYPTLFEYKNWGFAVAKSRPRGILFSVKVSSNLTLVCWIGDATGPLQLAASARGRVDCSILLLTLQRQNGSHRARNVSLDSWGCQSGRMDSWTVRPLFRCWSSVIKSVRGSEYCANLTILASYRGRIRIRSTFE